MNRLYSTYQAKINFIYLSFFIFSISILGKIFYIQTFKSSDYINKISENGLTERKIKGYRGNIYDKNGQVLAETIKTYTFWANTKNSIDKKNIIDLFSK